MNRSILKSMLATAALLVASTAASAQTLKVYIPFKFEAAGVTMPAGAYRIDRTDGEAHFILRNSDVRATVAVTALASMEPEKDWKLSRGGVLQFEVRDGYRLRRIWTHTGYPVHEVALSKHNHGEAVHLATLRITSAD